MAQLKKNSFKKEKWKQRGIEFLRYLFFLFFLGVLGGGLWLMIPKGMEQLEGKEIRMMSEIFDEIFLKYDNDPGQDTFFVNGKKIHAAYRRAEFTREEKEVEVDGVVEPSEMNVKEFTKEIVGFAFEVSGQGYGGPLRLWVGVDSEGMTLGMKIIEEREHRAFMGLVQQQKRFLSSLLGVRAAELRLNREGGEMHAVSTATVTSRGLVRTVKDAGLFYEKHRESFFEHAQKVINAEEGVR